MKKKILKFVIAILAVALGYLLFVSPKNDKPSDSVKKDIVLKTVKPTTPKPKNLFWLNWQANGQKMYAFQNIILTKMGENFNPMNQGFQMVSAGTLNVRYLSKGKGVHYVGFQLSPALATINDMEFKLLSEVLSEFFVVAFLENGKPYEYYFHDRVAEKDRNSLSAIVSSVQVVVQDHKDHQWQAEEENSLGKYVSNYQWLPEQNILNKSIVKYSELVGDFDSNGIKTASGSEAKILKSEYKYKVSPDSFWINELKSHEIIEIKENSNRLLAKTEQTVKLDELEFNPDPNLDIWFVKNDIGEILKSFVDLKARALALNNSSFERQAKISLQEKFFGVEVKDFIKTILSFSDDQLSRAEGNQIFKDMVDYLRAYPEKAKDFPDLIKTGQYSPRVTALLTHVLSRSAHRDAQEALTTMLTDNEQTQIVRLQSIVGVNQLHGKPEYETTKAVWDLIESNPMSIVSTGRTSDTTFLSYELKSTAFFAMGSMSRNLNSNGDPATAHDIEQKLIEKLHSVANADSTSDIDPAMVLGAIGNTGSDQHWEEVKPFLKAKELSTRMKAVEVTKNFKEPDATSSVVELMKSDEDAKARKTAFQTLVEKKSVELIPAVMDSWQTETDKDLKSHMIKFLGKNKQVHPDIPQALKEEIAKEQDRETLKQLYRAFYD
jgi:hypothetical protein